MLDLYLIRPILVLRLGEAIPERRELLDFLFGTADVAAARHPDRAGEGRDAFAPWEAIPRERRGAEGQGGGLRPALPLQSDARRNGGEGIRGGKTLRIRLANRRDLIGHALRRDVTARLEISVDEIVERMKGLIPDAVRSRFRAVGDARVRRHSVRVDGLLPQPQTREDVARHVKRVRRRRRDLRVAAGGGERSEERRVGKECRSRWSPYH